MTGDEMIVWPGEVARFEAGFHLTQGVLDNIPAQVDDKNFVAQFFTPVMDGVTWMEDVGMHLGVRVVE
jgi:hypothetical protein